MTLKQANFRLREDDYGLNVDNGWLATLNNVPSFMNMGYTYRVRIEVEEDAGASETAAFKLEVKVGAGSWLECGTQSDGNNTGLINRID